MAWRARDWLSSAFWAVITCWASKAIFLKGCTSLIEVSAWWAIVWLNDAFRAPVTSWALQAFDACKTRLSASDTFWALRALILEYTLLPLRVSAWRAVILILLVNDLGSHDGTPFTLGASVPIMATLRADISWLAATAVGDLTLCSLDTHSFEWAASR